MGVKGGAPKLLGAIRKCNIFPVATVRRQLKTGKQKKGKAKNSKAPNFRN